jgi:rSAM/selenodomain-associated transferase 1
VTDVLQIFARAPVAGECKTRLIPALGPEGAAALQRNLVHHTMQTASMWRASNPGAEVELWCAPDANHPFFSACAAQSGAHLRNQSQGDLGARMWLALMDALRSGRTPVLVGTDCPWLDIDVIAGLYQALAINDCAFIPAQDGGYVAVGMARAVPELFAGVEWGSAMVMAQTRARARKTGVRIAELGRLPDVDLPADLARLRGDPALALLLPAVS